MMTEERALSWVDQQQLEVRIVRESEIPEELRPNFHDLLYGEGQNGVDKAAENITHALKQRGQHVRR